MSKFESFFYKHLHFLRRFTQWATVAFIFVVPFLNRHGHHQILGTFYSLSIGQLDVLDPALMFQTLLLTKQISFGMLVAVIFPVVLALVLGRVFCGWMCPYNLMAEYVAKIRKKFFPRKKFPVNRNPKPHWYWLVFGTIVTALMILGIPLITLISFPGLISSQAADLVLNGIVGIEVLLFLIVLVLEFLFAPHFWCKYACPVGATLALFQTRKTMRVRFDPKGCTCDSIKSLPCNSVCPLGLDPRHVDIYPYCYNCGACIYACHAHQGKSLHFSFTPNRETVHSGIHLKTNRPIKEVDV